MTKTNAPSPPVTADTAFDAERYLAQMAALTDLPIDPAYRDGVRFNLIRLRAMASLVMEADLPDETEPASVFRP